MRYYVFTTYVCSSDDTSTRGEGHIVLTDFNTVSIVQLLLAIL